MTSMRYVIKTPEPRWTGEVAGVAFAHGQGITADDPPARVINYFRRRGYDVQPLAAAETELSPESSVSAEKKPTGRRSGTTSKETP
jgi:hypothetical protein